ncbi:MAG: MBL fold metallo-hydrolase [Candidatus Omnitrophica bacterium]|nr:MAG: Ribonuclease BN [Candidatus Hinthialibacteria bacterium OLB16]MBE7488026.1 MBL fold metallo-hydrolase [bacterium]MBK7496361.1 MBL fold metallo-hydrolase [Candidatus Omnitrophota bacterium]MCE7908103.1 MBL fold metallo-hydrolase [Candidatus Omnitrophica bacterium COP1]MBV6481674.1 Ribonuclease BN [bacterium]
MRVRIWGVRGSIPVPGKGTLKYGGNTPCVQFELPAGACPDPALIIFDAGSGIRLLGNSIVEEFPPGTPLDIHLFITHVHWDHIQGFPFFRPLYRENVRLRLYGPDSTNLERFLHQQMVPDYFPVSLDHADVKADVSFIPLDTEPVVVGPVTVRHHFVNHANEKAAAGYRVDSPRGGFVFIPDVEPADYPVVNEDNRIERELLDFIQGADLMLFDSTYTTEEYPSHRGWGHSPMDYSVSVAARGGVRRLGLYHYEPMREDDELDRLAEQARLDGEAHGIEVFASREGMILPIGE